MTEQERLDRETLLKRAAAAAGAAYVAPVLTSSASAEVAACPLLKCTDDRKCSKRGGRNCRCINGRCAAICVQDARCPVPGTPCDVLEPCKGWDRQDPKCVCFAVAPGSQVAECVAFPSNFCADYRECNRATGLGCPPGMCCMDSCCPEGLCMAPCRTLAIPGVSRRSGSGPTLTP